MAIMSAEQFLKGSKPTSVKSDSTKNQLVKKPGFFADALQDIKQTGSALKKTAGETIGKIKEINKAPQTGGQTAFQTIGAIAGGASSAIGDAITGIVKTALPQRAEDVVKSGITNTFEAVIPVASKIDEALGAPVGTFIEKYSQLDEGAKRNVDALLGIGSLGLDIATLGGGKKVVETGVKKGAELATRAVKDVVSLVDEKIPQYGQKAMQILAAEPAEQVKTILKETPVSKFDEYLKIAQQAAIDPRSQSVFEKVGDSLSEATKQLKRQASSLGAQKSIIIEKAKTGLQEFKQAPRQAILKVMNLEDSPLKDDVINILKDVKTKLDADKAIDDIQSLLYDATGTKLIAEGSKFEKQLKGIIGEMNDVLKNSLPDSYRTLNAKFADRTKIISTLNRALGEVVDGVPVRGASLIKQFFSPAGTKTKELFDFIKKSTGIDLAQDTTLAKFIGELFDDPKVRSLLEGLPTSKSGVIDKALEFTAEKTGLLGGLKSSAQKATLNKARKLLQR